MSHLNTKMGFWIGICAVAILAGCEDVQSFYSNVQRSDVFQQAYDDSRYDFLWVLDNSTSMKPRRDFVRDNMQSFLTTLNSRKAIDFQMAVTTTDMFSQYGDLVANPSGLKVAKSLGATNPIGDFASIVDSVSDSFTSFWEQGLETSYQAVYKHGSEFMRPGVPLIIIYVTDENDYSCSSNCYGVEPEHNPDWVPFDVSRYVNYFKTVKQPDNSEVVVFNIIGVQENDCPVASLGERYMTVQQEVGLYGESGSICENLLATSYNNIAKVIANRGTIFKLANIASGTGFVVTVDGVVVPNSPDNYTYDGSLNAIIFTGFAPKKGAVIEVTYDQESH